MFASIARSSAALAAASIACLVSTPVLAELACQAQVDNTGSMTVSFVALHNREEEALGFLWDFGDGAHSTEPNPTHEYSRGSLYRVTLAVTDPRALETCRDTVEVPVATVIDPLCWGTASTRWGDAPLGVQFDGRGRNIPDPPPYTCLWSFGDGTTSETCSPHHTYAPGTYWAVFTLRTGTNTYECSTLRITALGTPTPVRGRTWGHVKIVYR